MRGNSAPGAPIEDVRTSVDLCHVANIAHRAGAPAQRIDILRSIADRRELIASFDAMDEHLGRNGYDIHSLLPTLSGWQNLDPDSERFSDDPAANELLERTYRRPFVPNERVRTV